METMIEKYGIDVSIIESHGSLETYVYTYNLLTGFGCYIRLSSDMIECIRERCLVENHYSIIKFEYMKKHINEFNSIHIRGLELTLIINADSGECLNFNLSDPVRHNNIGFDHLYDDSEYPNDF